MLVEVSASVLTAVCAAVAYLFQSAVKQPYMDEVFHIPQAQRYCEMNFSYWDPMITTPPGLYFSSFLWTHPLIQYLGFPTSDVCTLTFLRGQNIVFTVLLFLVLHSFLKNSLLLSLNLTIFPVLFFFSFLYYTDLGATLFVLGACLLARKGYHFTSALSLLVSLSFRQTSVVWVVFVAGTVAIRNAESAVKDKSDSWTVFRHLISHTHRFLHILWPYALVIATFLTLVTINGSVALGDKKNHTLSFHAPQILYFTLFTLSLSPSLVLDLRSGFRFGRFVMRRPLLVASVLVVMCALMMAAVHYFTYEHPYLLADNRHYPFYVWKNVFRRHAAIRYLLVPVYAVSSLYILFCLILSRGPLWSLCFGICCFTTLVPQKLLEFRYFLIPFLILRTHIPGSKDDKKGWHQLVPLVMESFFYVLLNVATIWLFLYRPFKWPDSDDQQRFMW